jgi:hypothetical protein
MIGGGWRGHGRTFFVGKKEAENVFAVFKSSLFSTLYGFEGLAWQKLLFSVSV